MNSKNEKKKDKKEKLFDWHILDKPKSDKNSNTKTKNNLDLKKEGNKKSISDEFFMANDWESTEEEIYKDKILAEPWVKNSEYINFDEIGKNLPSFHYFDKHCTILESQLPEKTFQGLLKEQNIYENPNTKKIVRKGIPPNYMHAFILKLFDIKDIDKSHYDNNYSLIFKNHDIKNIEDFVPYFSDKKTLKENLPFHYLNKEGIHTLKIILWLICDSYRNIAYSPLIIKLVSIILLFCDKYETFEIMCKIIDSDLHLDEESENKIRWRLKFSFDDNKKLISSISQSLKELSPKNRNKYCENLEYLFFKVEDLYEDMCFNFFLDYLNFYGIIRLLPYYLTEGVKSFYRLIYAIENEIYDMKFTHKVEVIPKIREKCKKIVDIQELFNISFKFKLTRYNNNYIYQKADNTDILINARNDFYLPFFKGGNLLTDYEIIHLWKILPFEYKIKNCSIIY